MQVDPGVRVEPAVLDRDHGIPNVLGHLVGGEHHPVLGGVELGDPGAVAGVDEGRLGKRTLPLVLQSGKIASARHEGEHDHKREWPTALHHRGRSVPPDLRFPGEAGAEDRVADRR